MQLFVINKLPGTISILIEIKYIKPQGKKNELTPGKIKKIKEEAESQLDKYCRDEKFQKAIGSAKLVRLILVFCGHRLVYKGEAV
jgi:hypothetical protein